MSFYPRLSHKYKFLLLIFFFIGVFIRLYNLSWGTPFYFHPDERNIASSVSQLAFPFQMNPHFFAYGSFPIYCIYFTGILTNVVSNTFLNIPSQNIFFITFEQAMMISRIYSVLFSIIILLLLLISSTYFRSVLARSFCFIVATLSPGLIQFAHFGTFETWLTLWALLLFYVCLKIATRLSLKPIVIAGTISGLMLATKISSLPLITLPLIAGGLHLLNNKQFYVDWLIKAFPLYFLYGMIITCLFFITSPFTLLDHVSFQSSLNYEMRVALGTLPVFYTGEFFNTTPILFQFVRIYPFLLNPLLVGVFVISFWVTCYHAYTQKNIFSILIILFYLILFLPQTFIFAKWTRYIIPTLPFIYLMCGFFIDKLASSEKWKSISFLGFSSCILISVIYTFSFFITAYTHNDTRISAAAWTTSHIPSHAPILSEVYDLGITPFNPYFSSITLFNFYDLDSNIDLEKTLQSHLATTDYIIIPSQRIIKSRFANKEVFPKGYQFYKLLLQETLGFAKIYETPCDIFCKITYLNDPIFSFEQTTSVFDRPTVMIYKNKYR